MPEFTWKMFYEMKAVDELNSDAPDGSWWAMLEETAQRYVPDDANDAVHAYLTWLKEGEENAR